MVERGARRASRRRRLDDLVGTRVRAAANVSRREPLAEGRSLSLAARLMGEEQRRG